MENNLRDYVGIEFDVQETEGVNFNGLEVELDMKARVINYNPSAEYCFKVEFPDIDDYECFTENELCIMMGEKI